MSRRPALVVATASAVVLAAGLSAVIIVRNRPPAVPICSTLSPPPATPATRTVASGPRLRLGLGTDGSVSTVSEGGRALPAATGGSGFAVRLAGGTPNLVRDPGFELDADHDGQPDGWSIGAGQGTIGADGTVAHGGTRSVRISVPSRGQSGTVSTTLPVRPGTLYTASAWFRSQDVLPTAVTAYREVPVIRSPLHLEVQQLRHGATVLSAAAYGYTNTAGWNQQFVGFRAQPGVTRVRLVGQLIGGSGTAWIDDISVGPLLQPRSVPVRGRVVTRDGARRLAGATRVGGLQAAFRTQGDGIRVDGVLTGTGSAAQGQDRGFQLSFTLPVDARGWQWGDYARRSRTIRRGVYSYQSATSLQTTSRYPWSAIWSDRFGVAVGVPLDAPRIFRVAYETGRGLTITFDLGASPSAPHDRPTFSFVLYPFDHSWGFRAATQGYYDLFPASFTVRMNPACEGAWFVAPPLGSLDGTYRDFGLGMNMVALGKASSQRHDTWGTNYLAWDNERRITTTAYNHHWAFYDPLTDPSRVPPYQEAVAKLQREASLSPSNAEEARLRDEASAALVSTARDANGRLYFERYGDYLAYYEDGDPDPSSTNDWARAVATQQVQRALGQAHDAGGTLNGIHLDSTSGMRRWGAADDYARAHWATARTPLTFSYDSARVVERGVFPIYDDIQATAGFVHARGMLLSANYNADENRTMGFIGANLIDYFGLEQGLEDRTPEGVTTDQFAMMKRTLADQRPISTLDHKIGDGELTRAQIDERLQTNLFYGIFSGAFNTAGEADASSGDVTWSSPENAALWARYTPIFHQLAMAGWQPVTYARSSNPGIWVERFGSLGTGDLHLTLRNETARPLTAAVTLELRALGMPARSGPAVIRGLEEVGHASVSVRPAPNSRDAVFTLTIPPRSTRVVAVTGP